MDADEENVRRGRAFTVDLICDCEILRDAPAVTPRAMEQDDEKVPKDIEDDDVAWRGGDGLGSDAKEGRERSQGEIEFKPAKKGKCQTMKKESDEIGRRTGWRRARFPSLKTEG